MLMPPESKQTPFPTMARWRSSLSRCPSSPGAHHDHARRVVRSAADRHEHAHPELGRTLVVDDVDPEAVPLGDRTRLVGEDLGVHLVGGSIAQRPGRVRALADDLAPLGGRLDGGLVAARRDEDQLIELGRLRFDLGSIDRLGVVRTLDDAARHHLRGPREIAVEARRVDDRGQPDRHGADGTTRETTLRGRGDAEGNLAVDLLGIAGS